MSKIFSKKWLPATLLVLAAMAVMIRLGIWQLDRLESRRAFNARVEAQVSQPELDLQGEALEQPLTEMEYRSASVTGEYDFSQQIALRNQYYNNQWGVHLVTPLLIAGSDRAVLVDRGWIPAADYESGDWSQYDEPGMVTVQGVIRASRSQADYGSQTDPTPVPGGAQLQAWNFVNIPAISQQTSLALLPVYLQQSPTAGPIRIPVRTAPELDLTEGPHMGYALQWFTFAAILGIGYLVYLRRHDSRKAVQPEEMQSSLDRENG
jgi:surfeit locus 1 family protein